MVAHSVATKSAWLLLHVLFKIINDFCVQILFRGRHVFMGYLGMEEKMKETIDNEGWLHSGDIGRLDKVGCVV